MRAFFGRWMLNRKALLAVNAGAFALIGAGLGFGTSGDATPVLKTPLASEQRALEAQAALDPTPESVARLAETYVERGQPGLALALLDRFGPSDAPEPLLARAQALFTAGRTREALAYIEGIASSCDSATNPPCPTWVVAKKSPRARVLPRRWSTQASTIRQPTPSQRQAAFERSKREVRLVAIR